ncbi:hypothetical protein KFU94_04025 [Chloroflexi bacterium TSY]|nr:hypothetical protein [Chloroflexi bacterium TSY]
MLTAPEITIAVLMNVLQVTPMGTNVNVMRLMWAMRNGSFLKSRGAIHSALKESGFEDEELRRSWWSFRYGSWDITSLLGSWQGEWEAKKLEGYRVKSIDITGFWRPKLQGKVNRLYNSTARRALPALIFGVMISSGEIGGKRVPLLKAIMRCTVGTKESEFRKKLLTETKKSLESDEVAVVDAGFTIREMLESGIDRFVLREAINCTVRRNEFPKRKEKGRPPEYGDIVRPLSRSYKGKRLEATTPDSSGRFLYSGRLICYQAWHNLVPRTTKVDTANRTYSIYVIQDPAYNTPLVLATVMTLQPETIYLVYLERWPVEPPPLASKQMIGLHRQFVHADEACFRLPELGLLAGNLLSHLAASLPPIPTGYWARASNHSRQAAPCSLECSFPTPDQLDPDFRKRPRFHTIYLKAFSLIAASMPLLKLAEHYFYILSRFFRVDSFFRPFRFALCHSSLYQKVK